MLGEGTSRPAATGMLVAVCKGQWIVARYVVGFQDMAFWYNWSTASWADPFLQGLTDDIKVMLVAYEWPPSLDGAIKLATRLELQTQARGCSGQPSPPSGNASDRDLALPQVPPQTTASEPAPESAPKPAPVPEPVPDPVSEPIPEVVSELVPEPAPASVPEPAGAATPASKPQTPEAKALDSTAKLVTPVEGKAAPVETEAVPVEVEMSLRPL